MVKDGKKMTTYDFEPSQYQRFKWKKQNHKKKKSNKIWDTLCPIQRLLSEIQLKNSFEHE